VGAAGDTYFNTTNKTMYLSDGTSWIGVSAGAGTGAAFLYAQATQVGTSGASALPITWGTVLGQSGFSSGPGALIKPDAAGRYEISAQITLVMQSALTADIIANLEYYSSTGTLVSTRQFYGTGVSTTNYYSQVSIGGIYDLGVGEYFRITAYPIGGGTWTLHGSSFVQVVAASGATGAKGDTGAIGPAGTPTPDGFVRVASLTTASTVAVPATTVTEVVLPGVYQAQGSTYTNNGPSTRFTVPNSGVYDISAYIAAGASAWVAGSVVILLVNGTAVARTLTEVATAYEGHTISIQRYLNAGDYVSLALYLQGANSYRVEPLNASNNLDPTPQPYLSVWRAGAGLQGAQGVAGTSGSAVAVPPPYYSARKSTATSHVQNTPTQIVLDTIIDSNTGSADFYINNGGIFIVASGYYQIVGQVMVASTANNASISIDYWTGSAWMVGAQNNMVAAPAGATPPQQVVWETWLAAGTTVALFIYSTSAALSWPVATQTGFIPNIPSLSIVKAGGAKGDPGAAGAAGIQGPAGTTTQALVARGEWTGAAAYNPLEIVTRNGVAFLAMASNTNVDPGSIPYGSFAASSDALVAAIGKQLTWTPVFRQSVTLPLTVNNAWYSRVGEWVVGEVGVTLTGAGTAGQPLQMDLPVPIRNYAGGAAGQNIGNAVFIGSGGNQYGAVMAISATAVQLAVGGVYWTAQMVSGAWITFPFMYLAPVGV
jgi:hypothetical protein